MKAWMEQHPNLTTWLALAVGMVVVLAISARDVALSARQWTWLALATVLLAGACAWIISWEADTPDESGEGEPEAGTPDQAGEAGTDADA
jgi:hypothetical protein